MNFKKLFGLNKSKNKKPHLSKNKQFLICLQNISHQLERNADFQEQQNKFFDELANKGIACLKFDGSGITLSSKLTEMTSNLELELNKRPTFQSTQDIVEKEIEYQKQYNEFCKKYGSDIIEFINTISQNYQKLDKYKLLDAAMLFNSQYSVKKR